jgi:hypothetical protein
VYKHDSVSMYNNELLFYVRVSLDKSGQPMSAHIHYFQAFIMKIQGHVDLVSLAKTWSLNR